MSRVSVHTNAFKVRVSNNSLRYWTCDSMPLSAGILTKPAVHAAYTLNASMLHAAGNAYPPCSRLPRAPAT
eukprot:10363191-Alexandrium_andersonii.AAC.1